VKRPPPEALDLSTWPGVDTSALDAEARKRYQRRASAIEEYRRGSALVVIEEKTKVDRRVLYRMINRALRTHPDGRVWGFRALIPGLRTKAYERGVPAKVTGRGLAGAFTQLLERHEELEQLLIRLIRDREVWLVQKGERFYLPNLSRAHDRFKEVCRSLGLTARDYPLNHDEGGRRSLRAALRLRILEGFAEANRAAGGEGVKPAAALGFGPSRAVTDPFDTVEFDAHKLDLRLKILDQDPEGEEHVMEIERVWLLALIDVGSRAILGYTLCLRREYSRYDVIRTFEKALTPAAAPTQTIEDLELLKAGGFVSTALPETAYACWRTLRFDNARAHLAADSLDVACELLGCTVDAGPPYEPNDRPFIERFFGTVASRLIHRLPGTTGSSSDDILRRLRDVRGDLRLIVSLDELKELLAVWVWNYNGTPHGGLPGGRTPLEIIQRAVRERQLLLRHVPPELRGNLCLLQSVHLSRVRGNVERGDKPHISFYHVRYTSHQLAQSADMIGQSIRIFYDADDIRILRAYRADGTELGELKAGGLWSSSPHSLDLRKRIFKAKRLRQLRFRDTDDPVEAYLNYKRGQSKRSRKAASEIAQIKERIQADQRKDPPASSPTATPGAPEPVPYLATGPVKAKRLRIAPGYV
jgi:putative transposase